MKLHEVLTEDTIRRDVAGPDKTEAIAEVAGTLRHSPAVRDFDEFLGAVYAREMEGGTGIGNAVAIPHARTDSVSEFVAALGICRNGVDFQAVDESPVRLIILMGIPAAKVKAYLRLLAHLSLLLKQPSFVEHVLAARTSREVLDVLAQHEA